jgi:hypothetical protein
LIFVEGVTLVEIPYWWDRRKESVAALINKLRPELLVEHSDEALITETPPDQDDDDQQQFALILPESSLWIQWWSNYA